MSLEGEVRDGVGASFELIETMRWEPDAGFVRLERHMVRLSGSANELGFDYDAENIGAVLGDAVAGQDRMLRVRLALTADGVAQVSVLPYEPLPPGKVWNLRIAQTRLSSTDPLIRHKTSRRDVFVKARSEYAPEQANEVLLLNEHGELCEGTITNVFADMGEQALLTPALSCGLLPGVLRAELLAESRAREAVLKPADLVKAKRLFVGNSLRGLIPARLNE
jgi:4-amino-4-deoxychorismate lyase